MKLIADINIPYLRGVFERYFDEVLYLPSDKITQTEVKEADALLIRTRTICNKELLQNSSVKFIGSATIGFDHIDTKYCDSNGIKWVNSPGCNATAVLQWFVAAILYLSNNDETYLKGKVLGVVGVGNVGKLVSKAGVALGMNVLCCDPPRKRYENLLDFVDFNTIIKESDFISLHVPLNLTGDDATYHMINNKTLVDIKPNAIIINSSRGEVVDSDSIIRAINNKKLRGVAVDVWEREPNISNEFLAFTTIATPHIAGYSLEGKVKGTQMVVNETSNFFNFGLHSWFPEPNPLLPKAEIINPKTIVDLVKSTYSIIYDDKAFRSSPKLFETLRNNYKYRRDFSGTKVETNSFELIKLVKDLGFEISNK